MLLTGGEGSPVSVIGGSGGGRSAVCLSAARAGGAPIEMLVASMQRYTSAPMLSPP